MEFEYDVFLSHSSSDKEIVRKIAQGLASRGVRVWFDETEIEIGGNIPSEIEKGLTHSRHVILCMPLRFFASDWSEAERSGTVFEDPANKRGRLIPLLLEDCEIPPLLAPLKYADFREPDEAILNQLADRCLPADSRDGQDTLEPPALGPEGDKIAGYPP